MKCGKKCEVYSRVVGYLRPVRGWNAGKQEEFRKRRTFKIKENGGDRNENEEDKIE